MRDLPSVRELRVTRVVVAAAAVSPTRLVGDDVSRVGRFPLPALQSGDQRGRVGPVDLEHGRKHVPEDQTEELGSRNQERGRESFRGRTCIAK